MTVPIPTWIGLVWASVPILASVVVLFILKLGQVRPLLISLARMIVQLLLLGVVLEWLFRGRHPAIVGGIALVMLVISAHTVGSRLKGSGWALRLESFVGLAVGLVIVLAISIRLSLHAEPWYEPRVVVPLLGMVLGNSVTGVALAVERFESDLRADRDRVELRLALGASSWRASTPAMRAAVRSALTPIVNSMMIAGIVAIPGMTTGQLLVGAAVNDAIRYQIMIYLSISGMVAISTLSLLMVRLRHYFTPHDQLRIDRLVSR